MRSRGTPVEVFTIRCAAILQHVSGNSQVVGFHYFRTLGVSLTFMLFWWIWCGLDSWVVDVAMCVRPLISRATFFLLFIIFSSNIIVTHMSHEIPAMAQLFNSFSSIEAHISA